MWTPTTKGGWINLALATNINIYQFAGDPRFYIYAKLITDTTDNYGTEIISFDKEDSALDCVCALIGKLNGGEKVGYAFTWLTNKPAEKSVEKPVDNPADDSDLIDGVSL